MAAARSATWALRCRTSRSVVTPALPLTGLQSGYSVILSTNGMALVLTQNGDFRFANSLPNGTTYNVVVAQQPLVGTCQVTNPTGVTATNKLALVGVNCQ